MPDQDLKAGAWNILSLKFGINLTGFYFGQPDPVMDRSTLSVAVCCLATLKLWVVEMPVRR
ncbi:hypothetical protein C4K68_10585 [Pokkaliibacter plantistimulans]|uniref:Uncharacterized protein n=1 Tax=Proteobacteria bacterium 228 TaxID=2083153 RepID=A0A2S5KRL5_9PROT|nr:hypothetical protein C4K68_10585 [Pokkaliibacter plantistimulans]